MPIARQVFDNHGGQSRRWGGLVPSGGRKHTSGGGRARCIQLGIHGNRIARELAGRSTQELIIRGQFKHKVTPFRPWQSAKGRDLARQAAVTAATTIGVRFGVMVTGNASGRRTKTC